MKHCVDSPAERRLDRIDANNFEVNQRIKKVEEEIKLVELEIIEAATIEDCYHQKQLMRLVNHKENKIESIKRNLING